MLYPDCMFQYLKTLRKTALIKPLQGDFKVWVQINFQPFVKGNDSVVFSFAIKQKLSSFLMY